MKNTTPVHTIDDAVYALIHNSDVPAKAQAEMLGISYSRLMNCCIESAESAYHHTRFILPQTLLTRNFILMDTLERFLGRVAIPVLGRDSEAGQTSEDLTSEVMSVVKELGELVAEFQQDFKDKKLNKKEASRCKKETWDLITQAVKVYQKIDQVAE